MTARRRPNTTTGLLRVDDVCSLTALGRSSIYQLMRDGEFPMSVKIGGHAVRWRAADIARWIEELPASTRR